MTYRMLVVIFQLIGLCVLQSTLAKVPKGSLYGHLTYAEVNNWLREEILPKAPDLAKMSEIGRSVENRPIYAVCLGESCSKSSWEYGGEALYTGLHHAREPLGMMALVVFLDELVTKYLAGDLTTKHLLNRRRLYFVLVVNPDGYVANEIGDGMRRKNVNQKNLGNGKSCAGGADSQVGVDLNRNYDVCFDTDVIGSSKDPCAIDYRGPSPFSEPETQAMKRFVELNNFGVAFNYHSFGEVVYIPYSCKPKGKTKDDDFFTTYAKRLTKSNGYRYGQPWSEGLYTVNGDAADWMYATRGIYAVSPEVAPHDPVKSEHDGFWIEAEKVPVLARSTLEMNYVGAWTSGSYLETSLVPSSGGDDNVKILLQNWGLILHKGALEGVVIDHDGNQQPKKLFPPFFFGQSLPIKGEGKEEIELGSVKNATIAIKDDHECLMYRYLQANGGRKLDLMYRISPQHYPCVNAFAAFPTSSPTRPSIDGMDPNTPGQKPKITSNEDETKFKDQAKLFLVFISSSIVAVLVVALVVRTYRSSQGTSSSSSSSKFHRISAVEPDGPEDDEENDDETSRVIRQKTTTNGNKTTHFDDVSDDEEMMKPKKPKKPDHLRPNQQEITFSKEDIRTTATTSSATSSKNGNVVDDDDDDFAADFSNVGGHQQQSELETNQPVVSTNTEDTVEIESSKASKKKKKNKSKKQTKDEEEFMDVSDLT